MMTFVRANYLPSQNKNNCYTVLKLTCSIILSFFNGAEIETKYTSILAD